jgi:hypothetical protein
MLAGALAGGRAVVPLAGVVVVPPVVVPPPVVVTSRAAVSSGVVVSVAPMAQLACVIVFVSMVTAAVRANSLPWIVAAVFAVIDSRAMTVPTKRVPVPSVADDPTCQKTLQAWAPFTSWTVVFEPVISVEPI